MAGLRRDDVAAQAGVDVAFIDQLVALGVLAPDDVGSFTTGDVRRARLIRSLDPAGISIEDVAAAVQRGDFRHGVTFTSIGAADLKGVSGELRLFSAHAG